ncbi:glycosyltransferase family 2 protein [Candidatus Manganitrophus noduliformans]|uniref:Glycosyltransferase family 2 protein n=1 Tax=Candidatus Manganitrophus noduliformans TaxID=2606439 RepID=A0A7X6IB24_9BACT|nr:glycosyltransferase family 2 protein [Candidatus Manganitrophus noduliformans]NKE70974.1 glycosyltransferase family 2 protein [Candidatus Manganitrophus noduliformans]
MSRPKLSVTVITLNEEKEIGDCLDSAAWADEIVVVDSGSSDRTVEIAGKYTDKVFSYAWTGYAAQKNRALELATHPWVLSLDADERVSPELRGEIEQILESPRHADGYRIPRKNFFLGRWIRHGGWHPDYVLRFFKREAGRFGERKVHESVTIRGEIGTLRSPLAHYTYRSLEDYFRRMDRYSTLAAEEMFEAGKRANLLDLFLRPPATFLKMVVLRQGFRDGGDGLLLGRLYSTYTFAKYAKLYKMGRYGKDHR